VTNVPFTIMKAGKPVRHGSKPRDRLDHIKLGPGEYVVEGRVEKPPQEIQVTSRGKRREEYPPLEEFADAYYWSQRGDQKPMEAYLRKIDDVKAKHPK